MIHSEVISSKFDSFSRCNNINIDSLEASMAFMKQARSPDVMLVPNTSCSSHSLVNKSHSPRACHCTVSECEFDGVSGSNPCDYGSIPLQPLWRF